MVMMIMMIAVIELTVTEKRRPHRYLPNALAALDKLYMNSSGDEMANVNFFTTTSYMYRPAPTSIEPTTYFVL